MIVILALIPFHAFLTVWISSGLGHYTALRLWKEYLLVICLIASIYLFVIDRKLRNQILPNRLFQLIMAYLAIQVIWGLVAYNHHDVSKKALAYGLLLNCRYLIFFLITWLLALKSDRLRRLSIKLVVWPAVIVIVFGLLQIFILPRDFLSHFGYNLNTIPAFETINHNFRYIRIESTLRGANPLGAYLIIPLSLISVLLFKGQKSWKKIAFLIGGLIVLGFSFSRSAWIGSVIAIAISVFYSIKSKVLKVRLVYGVICILIILSGFTFALRNNAHVQNILWHTQTHSASNTSSDQAHSSALTSGIKNVATEPLGRGPGTAGPASVYNNHPARIAENYYVQIGQETGWLGLGLFLVINVYVGYLLWLKRLNNLELALFASFVGIFVVNIFSHAWSDDSLAYLWWGLAGIALASPKAKAKA